MITPKKGGREAGLSRLRLRAQLPYLVSAWLSCGAISITLTQRAYAGDGLPWIGDSGVLGPSLLALWGALFMLAVYAVNVLDNFSQVRRCGASVLNMLRLSSVPLLLLGLTLTLFAGATVSVGRALAQTFTDEWRFLPGFVASQNHFLEMPAAAPSAGSTRGATFSLNLPNDRVAIGGYDPGHKLVQLPLDLEHSYVRENDPDGLRAALSVSRNGRVPIITIEPYPPRGDERPVLDTIVLGERDKDVAKLADIVSANKPLVVYLRWGQEMDLSGLYPWAANDPGLFRSAFRRVVGLFREHGATNVRWIWSPAGIAGAEAYYPGDDVVDEIGLTILGDASWDHNYGLEPQSFAELLQPKYDLVQGFGKPIIVAELGVSGSAERQRDWLAEIPLALHGFPLIHGIVYFDAINSANTRTVSRPDWTIAPEALTNLTKVLTDG